MQYDLLILGNDRPGQAAAGMASRLGLRVARLLPPPSPGKGAANSDDPADGGAEPADVVTWRGRIALVGRDKVQVEHDGTRLVVRARRIVIATGSRPRRPRWIDFDGQRVLSSDELLQAPAPPSGPALVVGAGVRGLLCAVRLARLGASVVVLEQSRSVLSEFDPELVRELLRGLQRWGVQMELGQEVIAVQSNRRGVSVRTAMGRELLADQAVIAVGRRGNTEGLNLSAAGLETDEWGRLWCNRSLRTWIPHISAVGGVVGFPEWARLSVDQAHRVVGPALNRALAESPGPRPAGGDRAAFDDGIKARLDSAAATHAPPVLVLPTDPPLVGIGSTEPQLQREGLPYAVKWVNPSLSADQSVPLVGKFLFDPITGRPLGAHWLGQTCAGLIQSTRNAFTANGTIDDILGSDAWNEPVDAFAAPEASTTSVLAAVH